MRILHFLDCTGHGGDALAALRIAAEQQRSGHSVQIIIERSAHSEGFVARAQALGVPAREAAALIHDGQQGRARRILSCLQALSPYAGDVLHIHTGGLLVRSVDMLAARLLPFRGRFATIHSPFGWGSYPEPALYQRRWRRAAQLLDRVVTPSAGSAAVQSEAGISRQKLKVLPNPIPIDTIASGSREQVRNELGLAEGDTLVLFLSRLEEEKSPLDVIRAFGRVAGRFPSAMLAMAGTGALEQACQQLISELGLGSRVFMLGYRTDTANLLQAADIYMQPSRCESFGMSLVEAMAAGLPVITTNVGIIAELERPRETVQLVEAGDHSAMACALEQLLASTQLRQELALRAREAARRFDTALVAQQHLQLYQSPQSA